MKRYIIPTLATIIVATTTTFWAVTYFNYIVWTPLTDGDFRSDGSGNAGTIEFRSASYLDGSALRWAFWIQAVGTGTFASDAQIISPILGNPTRTCWTVEGTAESPNAGTIRLSGDYTDLKFNPVSRRLEWYGYNNWLGRVPFWTGTVCAGDNQITDTELATIIADGGTSEDLSTTSAGFVGRVKIIGNTAGNTVFDTFYSQGAKFNASLFNTTLQRIRKNVWLLTRNLWPNQKNWTNLVGDRMFLIDQPQYKTSDMTIARMNDIRSLIVVGGDLYINKDFIGTNTPKGIIVLKNENGVGGNVYVDEDVTNISASIFAEGTIYSGESSATIYNDSPEEIASLKPKQLYVLGAMISRNTLWGSSVSSDTVYCPYNETCTPQNATKYDLNYFRGFQASGGIDPNRAYKDATLDDYSLIIETDRRAIANPPPGFE